MGELPEDYSVLIVHSQISWCFEDFTTPSEPALLSSGSAVTIEGVSVTLLRCKGPRESSNPIASFWVASSSFKSS